MRCFIACCLVMACNVFADETGIEGPFLDAGDISWKVNEHNTSRWKTLVGGSEGGQINNDDVQFGVWQLAPHAIYHGHKHDAPEIYHITAGKARWIVDGHVSIVTAGSTIYTKPGQVHRMENLTDEPVSAIWIWWAPGGDQAVFSGEYVFTEPEPEQAEGARFSGEENERLY